MRKQIFDKLSPVYKEMWDSVEKNGYDVNSLSEFRTRVGSHYQKDSDSPFGLLIAGRCPNGWDENSADSEHLFPENDSPLIDVSRRIASHFYAGDAPEEHMAWTNAAHICDVDSGNVGKGLWKAQIDGLKKIAATEQELLSPQVSLLMTGSEYDWDEPYWDYLSAYGCSEPFREECITNNANSTCKFLAYECEKRLFIITDRPDTFARQTFADIVCEIIGQWLGEKQKGARVKGADPGRGT
ncbi:MAG: hypothetical protein ACI4AE_00965 [Candidatus Cryptobacteroides sp.]